MKKTYEKPLLEKVDFKFTEHIATSTSSYEGGQYNNDNSHICRHLVVGCA